MKIGDLRILPYRELSVGAKSVFVFLFGLGCLISGYAGLKVADYLTARPVQPTAVDSRGVER